MSQAKQVCPECLGAGRVGDQNGKLRLCRRCGGAGQVEPSPAAAPTLGQLAEFMNKLFRRRKP